MRQFRNRRKFKKLFWKIWISEVLDQALKLTRKIKKIIRKSLRITEFRFQVRFYHNYQKFNLNRRIDKKHFLLILEGFFSQKLVFWAFWDFSILKKNPVRYSWVIKIMSVQMKVQSFCFILANSKKPYLSSNPPEKCS